MTTHKLLFGSLAVVAAAAGALVPLTRASEPAAVAPAAPTSSGPTRSAPAVEIGSTRAATPTAPRAPSAPKRSHGAQLLAKIRDTAPVTAGWTRTAEDVIAKWRAAANLDVELGAFDCHAAGCTMTATFTSELAFETGDESLTKSEAFLSYPGWRHRSIHRDTSGKVVATWFFMNPIGS